MSGSAQYGATPQGRRMSLGFFSVVDILESLARIRLPRVHILAGMLVEVLHPRDAICP